MWSRSSTRSRRVTATRERRWARISRTYIALATANRVVAPCSKLAFADWWAGTAGPRWVRTPAGALDHRRFWDAMDQLDADALSRVEAELGRRMVSEFELDLSALVLDMTNFATYIDSTNDRAP